MSEDGVERNLGMVLPGKDMYGPMRLSRAECGETGRGLESSAEPCQHIPTPVKGARLGGGDQYHIPRA